MDNDGMLVHLYMSDKGYNKEPNYITAFYVRRYAEFLKMINHAKRNEIVVNLSEWDENISEKYKETDFYIQDFNLVFGSSVTIPSINVYLM